MKPACLFVAPPFNNNRLFEELEDGIINRDDQLRPWRLFKAAMKDRGYDVQTQEHNAPLSSAWTLFMEMPAVPVDMDYGKSFLILQEPPVVRPDNWDIDSHSSFRRVFTWDEKLCNASNRYSQFRWPQAVPKLKLRKYDASGFEPFFDFQERRLCTMIAGGKNSFEPGALYFERVKWIQFFEEKRAKGLILAKTFDLYGRGWNWLFETHRDWLKKIGYRGYLTSYAGNVESKFETLQKYRFAIAYENQVAPGYITEKIFDCLFAGCIPIYYGDPGITEKIPKECFIDARDYNSRDEIVSAMVSMTKDEWVNRQFAITSFLSSKSFESFTCETFVKNLTDVILAEIKDWR